MSKASAQAALERARKLNRQRWYLVAARADSIARQIGDLDEAARVSAEFVATRLRRLADGPHVPPIMDVELPEEGE